MDDRKFRQKLEELKDEIDKARNVDPKGQKLLQRTRKDIEDLMDQSKSKSPDSHKEKTSRLEETIAYLEVTHPQLTVMLTDLLDILGNAGV